MAKRGNRRTKNRRRGQASLAAVYDLPFGEASKEFKKRYLQKLMEKCSWDMYQAAEAAQLPMRVLRRLMRELDLLPLRPQLSPEQSIRQVARDEAIRLVIERGRQIELESLSFDEPYTISGEDDG